MRASGCRAYLSTNWWQRQIASRERELSACWKASGWLCRQLVAAARDIVRAETILFLRPYLLHMYIRRTELVAVRLVVWLDGLVFSAVDVNFLCCWPPHIGCGVDRTPYLFGVGDPAAGGKVAGMWSCFKFPAQGDLNCANKITLYRGGERRVECLLIVKIINYIYHTVLHNTVTLLLGHQLASRPGHHQTHTMSRTLQINKNHTTAYIYTI
jgi:hypothetical protein